MTFRFSSSLSKVSEYSLYTNSFSRMKFHAALLAIVLLIGTAACAESSISFVKGSFKLTYVRDGEKIHREWISVEPETISKVASSDGFTAEGTDSVAVHASFVNAEGDATSVQQAFLRFVNKRTGADNLFLLKRKGRDMKLDLNLRKEVVADRYFWKAKDTYAVELVMGDLNLEKSATWVITEDMRFAEESQALFEKPPGGVFDFDVSVKKEILPEFFSPIPDPEKRAPFHLIAAALVGVLLPLPLLFVGWSKLGVFPLELPKEKGQQVSLFGFEACMVGHVVALAMFWVQWNIVTTWKFIGVLMIPTVFFGRNVLCSPDRRR